MNFGEAKRRIIEALLAENFEFEDRADKSKNLLSGQEICLEEAAAIIARTRGNEATSSTHHFSPAITVREVLFHQKHGSHLISQERIGMPRQEGDRDELICNHCEALRECEYSYGPYEYEGETIEDVFRSVCLTCRNVLTIDARSTYRLAEAKSRKAQRRTSVSLPIEMQDQIASDLMRAGSNWSHAELYFRAILVACHDDPEATAKLVVEVQDDILRKPNKARLNVCLGKQLTETLDKIAEASGIRNTSEIIRRLVVLTRGPIRIPFQRELRSLALAYA